MFVASEGSQAAAAAEWDVLAVLEPGKMIRCVLSMFFLVLIVFHFLHI